MGSLNIVDAIDYGREIHYPFTEILVRARSHVQEIVIAKLDRFGDAKNLWIGAAIDNWKLAPQFSTHDEHRYHQMLAFPPLAALRHPRRGRILGGGDWPLAARIAMRVGVEHVEIDDWDQLVGKLVLQFIPEIARFGVHTDQRFDFSREIDVAELLPQAPTEADDFIFGDLTDISDLKKIQPDFLRHTFRMLQDGGFVAFQAGAYGFTKDCITAITEGIRDLREAGFRTIWLWREDIDSFGYPQLYMAGWKNASPSREPLSEAEFGGLFETSGDRPHYTPAIHRRAFTLDVEMEDLVRSVTSK